MRDSKCLGQISEQTVSCNTLVIVEENSCQNDVSVYVDREGWRGGSLIAFCATRSGMFFALQMFEIRN